MKYKTTANKKHIFKLIVILLLVFGIVITSKISVRAEDNLLSFQPKEGLVKVDEIPDYTDEQFNSSPVRITVFSSSWCTYCKELKEEFPKIIYSKFSKDFVAIRIWEIDSPRVVEYFEKFAEKNDIQPEFRSQIPFIFINEKYPYLGYSEEIINSISEDIEAIFSEMEPPHGGNLEVDEAKNNNTFNENIKNTIENGKVSEESKVYFLKAGFLDSFKFLFLLLFSMSYLFILNINKNNKYLLFFMYFIGIISCNLLTLVFKVQILLGDSYVTGLKIILYVATTIIIFEFIVNLLTGSIKDSDNKPPTIFIRVLNSRFIYFITLVLGFLVMNSQVNISNANYIFILNSISSGKATWEVIFNILLYSLSLILVSVIITLFISIIKDFIKKNRDLKAHM
jgi:glutaredoxin